MTPLTTISNMEATRYGWKLWSVLNECKATTLYCVSCNEAVIVLHDCNDICIWQFPLVLYDKKWAECQYIDLVTWKHERNKRRGNTRRNFRMCYCKMPFISSRLSSNHQLTPWRRVIVLTIFLKSLVSDPLTNYHQ